MLADQLSRPAIVLPLAQEELAQEGVERFLLVSILLTPTSVLLLESGQEPFKDEQGSLGGIWLLGGGDEG